MYNWRTNISEIKIYTFSVFFDAEIDAVEEGEATACKILFELLFISFIVEEAAPVTTGPLLLILAMAVVVINDCGKVICFPGEAKTKIISCILVEYIL